MQHCSEPAGLNMSAIKAFTEGLLEPSSLQRRNAVQAAQKLVDWLVSDDAGASRQYTEGSAVLASPHSVLEGAELQTVHMLLSLSLEYLQGGEEDAVVLQALSLLVRSLTCLLVVPAPSSTPYSPAQPLALSDLAATSMSTSPGSPIAASTIADCPSSQHIVEKPSTTATQQESTRSFRHAQNASSTGRKEDELLRSGCALLLGSAARACTTRFASNPDILLPWLQAQVNAAKVASSLNAPFTADREELGSCAGPLSLILLAEQTAALVRKPDLCLFATVGGVPAFPQAPELQERAALAHRTTAAALSLMQQLLLLLPHLGTQPSPCEEQSRPVSVGVAQNTHSSHVTIVQLERTDGNEQAAGAAADALQARQRMLAVDVLRLCATYGGDPGALSGSPRLVERSAATAGDVAGVAAADMRPHEELQEEMDAVVGVPLFAPWANEATHTSSLAVMDVLSRCQAAAALHQQPGHLQQQPQQQPQSQRRLTGSVAGWQEGLAALGPDLVAELRSIVLQKRLSGADVPASSEYKNFERAIAARQVAWLIRALRRPVLSKLVPTVLPLVLAAAEDTSPVVAVHGVHALHHLAGEALAADLLWQHGLLLDVARKLVQGCRAALWPAVVPATTALVRALEGRNVRSSGYHEFFVDLLAESERNAHLPAHRLVVLQVFPSLLEGLRLTVVRHFARLLPLLLEWLQAHDAETRMATLTCLQALVRFTWPRIPAHAAVLWQHLASAYTRAGHSTSSRLSTPIAAPVSSGVSNGGGADGITNGNSNNKGGLVHAASSCLPSWSSDTEGSRGAVADEQTNTEQAAIVMVCELLAQCGGERYRQVVLQAAFGSNGSHTEGPHGQGDVGGAGENGLAGKLQSRRVGSLARHVQQLLPGKA